MTAARRFPFGHEPVLVAAPEEPPSRASEPLVGFTAPVRVLPFRAPPRPPAALAAPPVPVPPPVVVRPRRRRSVSAWIVVALAVMVVLDATLLFLVVRGLS